jgi:hypothetical protein
MYVFMDGWMDGWLDGWMLRPIAENPFADRQIAEFQFAEKLIC